MPTEIQWTDETWNPVTGCSKVSPGCAHCYAETVALRFWPTQYRPLLNDGSGKTIDTISTSHHEDYLANGLARPRQFTDVMCHEDRLDQPLRWRKPRRIFVNSMSDLFHEDVPDAFIDRVFAVMALAPQHTFQVLTKRAQRMHDYMRSRQHPSARIRMLAILQNAENDAPTPKVVWPLRNVWLGVSVENQRFADKRIPLLLQAPAAVRFISAEPLLGLVDLKPHMPKPMFYCSGCGKEKFRPYCSPCGRDLETVTNEIVGLDWVIVGGESGKGARPFDLAWARSIIQQCQSAGVPVFVKQLGARVIDRNDAGFDGCDERSWPEAIEQRDAVEDNIHGYREEYQGAPVRIRLLNKKGGDPSEWPSDLRVREFPREAVHAD